MKFIILEKNIPWDSDYNNFPSFFNVPKYRIGSKKVKQDWLINNFTSFDKSEITSIHNSFGSVTNKISRNSILLKNLSDYSYMSLNQLMSSNYAIVLNQLDRVVQYFFIKKISLRNAHEIEIEVEEDILYKNFEKIYNSLPLKINVNRAHIDRYILSSNDFNWSENSKLLLRDPLVENYNPILNKTYPLTINDYNSDGEPAILIFVKKAIIALENNHFSEEHLAVLNGIKLPYIVLALPLYRANNGLSHTVATHVDYLDVINDEVFSSIESDESMVIDSFIINTSIVPTLPLDISSQETVQLLGATYGFRGGSNAPIKSSEPAKKIIFIKNLSVFKDIKLKINDFNDPSIRTDFLSHFSNKGEDEPRLSQYPFKKINISSVIGNDIKLVPEIVVESKDKSPTFNLSIGVTPSGISQYFSIESGFYKNSKLIGDIYRSNTHFVLPYVDSYKNILVQEKTNFDSSVAGSILSDSIVSGIKNISSNWLEETINSMSHDSYLAWKAVSKLQSHISNDLFNSNSSEKISIDSKYLGWSEDISGFEKIEASISAIGELYDFTKTYLTKIGGDAVVNSNVFKSINPILEIAETAMDFVEKPILTAVQTSVKMAMKLIPTPFKLAAKVIQKIVQFVVKFAIFSAIRKKLTRDEIKQKHTNIDAGKNFVNVYNLSKMVPGSKELDGFKYRINVKSANEDDSLLYKSVLDNYGYYLNTQMLREIAFNGRRVFNYIQSESVSENLILKQAELEIIEMAFSTGIRFWHQEGVNSIVWNDFDSKNNEKEFRENYKLLIKEDE